MTLNELIADLEALRAEHGENEVVIEVYNGGDDVLCFVRPELREGRVLLRPHGLAE